MNYLSSVVHSNGLPTETNWDKKTNSWKRTSGNYAYMTNANGITNSVYAGDIQFGSIEEAKMLIDTGLLAPQSGDLLYNIPSNQPFPDHGYVINGVDIGTDYPFVTGHTTNRLDDDFDVALSDELREAPQDISYSYSYVYMGGLQ